MLLPKSSCVYMPHIKSVVPRVCLAKVPFLDSFGPDTERKVGVVIYMYLKHSSDYIDSKYIWVHWFNSLGSNVSAEIPFWH